MTKRRPQARKANPFFQTKAIQAALFAVGFFAFGSAFASDLGEKIQKELDSNPVLQRQQVKMRVLEERDGSVSLEMSEGPKDIRDMLRKGMEVEGAGFSLVNQPKDSLAVLIGLRRSLRNIKRFEGVKEVTITGALNSVLDQAETFYNDAMQQLNKEQLSVEDMQARRKAVRMLVRAAEMGFVRAQSDLGAAYAFGIGVERDDEQAIAWFRKAADNGDASSLFNLGKMYAAGRGVEKDYKQAIEIYRKAAEQERSPDIRFKALNALAAILAACPDEKLRDGPAALDYAQKALAANPSNKTLLFEVFAAAYARCGRFPEAVEQEKAFIQQLDKVNGGTPAEKEKLRASAQKRLELYQNKQAYAEQADSP